MNIFITIVIIILPNLMLLLHSKNKKFRVLFHVIALLAMLLFFIIASLSVYQIIKDNTVLMTNIHLIFLNPLFLLSSFYLGIYTLYLLLVLIIHQLSFHSKIN